MKHRGSSHGAQRSSSKLKLEHGIIQGVRKILEGIAEWDEISSIIPARINPKKSYGNAITLTVQYETANGLKCLAKSGNAVQEIFIVTQQKDIVRVKLAQFAAAS